MEEDVREGRSVELLLVREGEGGGGGGREVGGGEGGGGGGKEGRRRRKEGEGGNRGGGVGRGLMCFKMYLLFYSALLIISTYYSPF